MIIKFKKSKKGAVISRRTRERLALFGRRFDLTALALALLIVLSGIVCANADCSLKGASASGFLLWFLQLPGYLPLELLSFYNALTGSAGGALLAARIAAQPALAFPIMDLTMLVIVWLWVRLFGARRYGEGFLHGAWVFVLIFAIWGAFQLFLAFSVHSWPKGGGIVTKQCVKTERQN